MKRCPKCRKQTVEPVRRPERFVAPERIRNRSLLECFACGYVWIAAKKRKVSGRLLGV